MSRKLKCGMVGIVVVGLLTVSVAGSALAQGTAPSAAPNAVGMQRGGFGREMCGETGTEAAAKALGLSVDQMSAELWGGRTMADLADRAGVDLTTVWNAVQGACKDVQRNAVEQAVTDGSLTREKADWLLEGLDKGYWGSGAADGGFGPGMLGPGGFAPGMPGPRGFGRMDRFDNRGGPGGAGGYGPGGYSPGGAGNGPGGPGNVPPQAPPPAQ
jgi:hypothetical protein